MKKIPMILLVTLVTSLAGGEGIRDEVASLVLIALLLCYLIQVSSAIFGISGFRWCRKYSSHCIGYVRYLYQGSFQ